MKEAKSFGAQLDLAFEAAASSSQPDMVPAGVVKKAAKRRAQWGAAALLWLTIGVVVALLIWASRSELDSIVRGGGQVIPDSSTQVVQSLEGGLVSEIFAREGDSVEQGQLLMQLHDTQYASIHRSNEEARDTIMARMVRLEAEAGGAKELAFPAELLDKRKDLVAAELELFDSRRRDMDAKIRFGESRLAKEREKYEVLKPSFDSGALPTVDRLDLEAKLVDLEEKVETTKTGFVRLALESLDEERERLATLLAQMEGDKDRMVRTAIYSPIDGVVNKIHIDTAGRVVGPGEAIMEIVPRNDTLLVEARIRPADIAFLYQGQEALVNFTAYDFSIYGGLKGKVETIGVDTVSDPETKETFYPIKIRTFDSDLGKDLKTGDTLKLVPGMVAEVNVITGKRTVMDYLLKPINRAKKHALRER